CVLALRLGYYIYKKNLYNENGINFFIDKCIVVGSGPFCWLPIKLKDNFSNLSNIQIFLHGSYYELTYDSDDSNDSNDSNDSDNISFCKVFDSSEDKKTIIYIDPIIFNIIGRDLYPNFEKIKTFSHYYPMYCIYDQTNESSINGKYSNLNVLEINTKKGFTINRYVAHDWDTYYGIILQYLDVDNINKYKSNEW
ncbi:unnamed protein product, partial [marine sediment metagenome]